MKVSKNSWHYRMLSHFPWEISSLQIYSLCGYFWMVVWTFVFCLVVVPVGAAIALGIAAFVGWIVFYPILQFWFPNPEVPYISAPVDTALLLCLWCWYRKKYVSYDKCSETASLVAEYVSAKHRKVCPLLEFE